MERTSASLLQQLHNPADQNAWKRFVRLYTPLLYAWAHRIPLQDPDAADLVQDVFLVLVRKLPEFQYAPDKSFRAWLKTVLLNKWRELQRHRAALPREVPGGAIPDCPEAEDTAGLSDLQYRQQLVSRALQLIRGEFPPAVWRAFQEYAIVGRPAPEVARELSVTTNAVYIAKCRVLRRLRQELTGLVD